MCLASIEINYFNLQLIIKYYLICACTPDTNLNLKKNYFYINIHIRKKYYYD